MTRRLLGPVGGPIAFLLVAGLVFAGLGWVTIASLRVEEAQREAARRADREKELRLALTRMDARMLPALGVEDTRPFHEFKTFATDDPITVYGPASAPLLAGDLPDWMQLHFQLDPEGSWESPQVLDRDTKLALRRQWQVLSRNATKAREEHLAALNARFPARSASEAFAARERAYPAMSPPSTPLSFNDGLINSELDEPIDLLKPTIPEPVNAPVTAPPPAPIPDAGAEAKLNDRRSGAQAIVPPAIRKFAEADLKSQGAAEPKPAGENENLARNDGKKTRNVEQSYRSNFDESPSPLGNALKDVARFQYQLVPGKLLLQNSTQQQKKSASGQTDPAIDRSLAGRATDPNESRDKEPKGGFGFGVPWSEYRADSTGFFRLLEEARTRELERKQLDNLHRGGLKKEAERKDEMMKDSAKGALAFARPAAGNLGAAPGVSGGAPAAPGAPGAPPPTGLPAPGFGPPAAKSFAIPPPASGPALGAGSSTTALPSGGGSGAGGAPVRREPMNPTPDPAPPAMLLPAEPPMLPPAALDDAVAPPLAVHLGTLRPQWLTGTDGTPLLVLVRAARIENKKTVYQGVVLDWAKLQALLQDEVKDLFPGAKLEPVKDTTAESREQSMTALPVRLDPGAESTLPPAGWTPLRIGLVLVWVAALIAFAAVGLTGWSLVELAERRIRFVSAVTHELRTPLTSLRLYLDLLLSGMVQDEDKRREYLSTLNVESDRLHRLIDNVLDFAKLERSRKGRDLQPVKAADLLDSIRLTWMDRVAADGKELITTSALPEDLGITTDGSLVQQIVGNLVDNARKYTREAADTRIQLRATLDGTRLVFEVEDRGCGVPAREQKTIFRPFRRGDTADTKAGGAGLGLALSKEWAELLGGRLTYRTPEGGIGSCFRLELPAKS